MKLLKVRRKNDCTVYGIGANTLEQCIEKGCRSLTINPLADFLHMLSEDVVVADEDYFQALPANSLLIFECRSDRDNRSVVDAVKDVLERIRMDPATTDDLIEAANDVASDVPLQELLLQLAKSGDNDNWKAEKKHEHVEWFNAINNKSWSTKSRVMEESAKSRISSYFYDAKKTLEAAKLTKQQRIFAKGLMQEWKERLLEENHYGHYFSRTHHNNDRFCDRNGSFDCEGDYRSDDCNFYHRINPYRSAEERVVFSTWNLDHQIEKARTVLPRVIKLIQQPPALQADVDWEYFYSLMFTRGNLKLVHIACHDKRGHTEATIDENRVFL